MHTVLQIDAAGSRWSILEAIDIDVARVRYGVRYIVNSPFYRLDRIHTPLLIVAGKEDNTVPYIESKKLFAGLRRLERPARLLIYPGEGHVISSWSTDNAADVSRRMVAFLRKHLMRE